MLFEKKLEIPVLLSTVLFLILAVADVLAVAKVFQNVPQYKSLAAEAGILGMKAFALFIFGICFACIWPFKAVDKGDLQKDVTWIRGDYHVLRNNAWQVRGVNNGFLLWEQEYWGKASEPRFENTWFGALAQRRWQLNRLEAAMAHFHEHGFDLEPGWQNHQLGSAKRNTNFRTLDFA